MSTDEQTPEQPEEREEEIRPTAAAEESPEGGDFDDDDEEDRSEMAALYDETLKDITEGEVVRGTIVKVTDQEVLVDVGFKSEGAISIREFRRGGEVTVSVGDEIEVFLEEAENKDGHVVLSKEKADKAKVWEEITRAFESDE